MKYGLVRGIYSSKGRSDAVKFSPWGGPMKGWNHL